MARKFPQPKGPDDLADYVIDFSAALPEGDVVVGVVNVEIDPEPGADQPSSNAPNLALNAALFTGQSVVLWLSAGRVGWTYQLGLSVMTSGGRTLRRHVTLRVAEL